VLDRCTDGTKGVCQKHGVGEVVDFALKSVDTDLVMVVDADVQLPKDALVKLSAHLSGDIACVSATVKSRAGKNHLDVLMWLRDVSYSVNA